MKKILVFLNLMVMMSMALTAQNDAVLRQLQSKYGNYNVVYYGHFKVGCFGLKNGKYWGAALEDGTVVVPPTTYIRTEMRDASFGTTAKIDDAQRFYFLVETENNEKGILDLNGKILLRPGRYDDVKYDFSTHKFTIVVNKKMGLLDSLGNELLMPVCENCLSVRYEPSIDGFVATKSKEKVYGFEKRVYNRNGKEVFRGETIILSEGVIAFKEDSKWGFARASDGKILENPKYTTVMPFENGRAKVSTGGTVFLINNPLNGGGVVSEIDINNRSNSDIDINIPKAGKKEDNSFAVIIANESYDSFFVHYAAADGKVFREYCQQTLGIPKDNIFYRENITLNGMASLIKHMKEVADVFDGEAKIVFYYSGMGLCDEAGNSYLLPTDWSAGLLPTTSYSVRKLYDELGSLNTTQTTIIIDAGFNGENRDGKMLPQCSRLVMKRSAVPITGKMTVLEATSPGETAFSLGEKGHGSFTYFLCKKLQETKGLATLKELSAFVIDNVRKTSSAEAGKVQTPRMISTDENNLQKNTL